MAPKRSRGVSSSETSLDSNRFVSQEEAANWYQRQILARSIVPERGIVPDDSHHHHLHEAILVRGWSILVQHPDAGVASIVSEFYANIQDGDSHSFVRGRRVDFGAATLNAYYQLPSYDRDDYFPYAAGTIDYTQVIQTLCRP